MSEVICRASRAYTSSRTAGRGRSTLASHRIWPGFTSRYGCNRLVFCEKYERMDEAIAREKQIKGGSRAKKVALIEAMNPQWRDLYADLA